MFTFSDEIPLFFSSASFVTGFMGVYGFRGCGAVWVWTTEKHNTHTQKGETESGSFGKQTWRIASPVMNVLSI
jgi:hypothetical protein